MTRLAVAVPVGRSCVRAFESSTVMFFSKDFKGNDLGSSENTTPALGRILFSPLDLEARNYQSGLNAKARRWAGPFICSLI